MCGICLVAAGFNFHDDPKATTPSSESAISMDRRCDDVTGEYPTIDDLAQPLSRRGPDSIGSLRLGWNDISGHDTSDIALSSDASQIGLQFIGATLQLRGSVGDSITQPLVDKRTGNVLLFNGEIFGGLVVDALDNDGSVLLSEMSSSSSIPATLSRIRGPWAAIFWHAETRTLWYGRDVIGRRSLLIHLPSKDPRLIITSVSPRHRPPLPAGQYWEDVPCGIFSLTCSQGPARSGRPTLVRRHHPWQDELALQLSRWQRSVPCESFTVPAGSSLLEEAAEALLEALSASVGVRVTGIRVQPGGQLASSPLVGVLFSGGIDSMILAALADRHVAPSCAIELLNVSFAGSQAPDRKTALAGFQELQRMSPNRRWHLVEVDSSLECMELNRTHILSLIHPSNTHMDLNIGTALWMAAEGQGRIVRSEGGEGDGSTCRSRARVLLVGTGADEQCGGYSRYRTKFRAAGWQALEEEMSSDVRRLWKRNLGRDDRCISDRGKEARFPFLDENVMSLLLSLPMDAIVDLSLPLGVGDKQILRQVARKLGIVDALSLPKRAIQFGSRIAGESNRRNFGSNRAANQANAGSMVIMD